MRWDEVEMLVEMKLVRPTKDHKVDLTGSAYVVQSKTINSNVKHKMFQVCFKK